MNDSIYVSNKIISYNVLIEIFDKMSEKFETIKKISKQEEMRNQVLDYQYQTYTFKDSNSSLEFTVYYYDDTSIKYNNYPNFVSIFNSRLHEVREIKANLYLSYSVKEEGNNSNYFSQSIRLDICEKKANMDFSVDSNDKRIEDVYLFIKEKINSCPVKYNNIIKKKNEIINTIGFAKGFIPAAIICIGALFFPIVRQLMSESYVLLPIALLTLSFLISSTIFTISISKLYENITPELEYAGYSSNGGIVYKENIEKYTETSEILIGKNANNLSKRNQIEESYKKYKKIIPYEMGIMAILSIIVLFL